jgi:hypothetical protein
VEKEVQLPQPGSEGHLTVRPRQILLLPATPSTRILHPRCSS